MREIDKAVELLRPLLEGLAKDRDRMVDISWKNQTVALQRMAARMLN